jgi:hypothetical protein
MLYVHVHDRHYIHAHSVAIAELVPHLGLVISLVGAYGSSSLSLLFPAIVDVLTERARDGRVSARTWAKDGALIAVALVAMARTHVLRVFPTVLYSHHLLR